MSFEKNWITIAGLAIVVLLLSRTILRGFLGPHSSLPGPWYSRFTSFPYLYSRIVGHGLSFTRRLHESYGLVVRLGPGEVSVNSVDGYHRIHSAGSGFTKPSVFDSIRFSHSSTLFTIRDQQLHAERKRILGRGFSIARAANWDARVHRLVQRAVGEIKRDALGSGRADVYQWWRRLAIDVIAETAFGEPLGMLEASTDDKMPLVRALEKASQVVVLQVIMGSALFSLLRWCPIPWLKDIGLARDLIFDKAGSALESLKQQAFYHGSNGSIFGHVLNAAASSDKGGLTDDAIRSEAAMMIVAGSDNTATVMTYVVWEVLRRPSLHQKLEKEVAQLTSDFDRQDVEALPLLNNVIEEALRLYNAAAGPVARLVPTGGAEINGWYLPKNTTVFTQSWLLSRSEETFPDAERFEETRFENLTSEQQKAHVPFSVGARRCIGMQLAKMEVRLALAVFFRECKGARLHDDMTDSMMGQTGRFFIVPKGGKCDITLSD